MTKTKLFTLLFFFAASVPMSDARGASSDSIRFERRSFESGGKRVQVDFYEPAGEGAHPTVLCLYGAGGLIFDGSRMRDAAQRLVAAGNRVYLVHYFNQTHTFVAAPWTMRHDFTTWRQTVHDSIDWVAQQPGSSAPIGIYGFSLGGFLAISAASDNPHVGAVVSQAGGIADKKVQQIGRMPPLLLVHGGRDKWVPFKEYAEPLVASLQEHHVKFETRFFPQEGHKFKPLALEDTRLRAINFFRRNLRAGNQYAHRAGDAPR
jgi:dienelactone hydrolase